MRRHLQGGLALGCPLRLCLSPRFVLSSWTIGELRCRRQLPNVEHCMASRRSVRGHFCTGSPAASSSCIVPVAPNKASTFMRSPFHRSQAIRHRCSIVADARWWCLAVVLVPVRGSGYGRKRDQKWTRGCSKDLAFAVPCSMQVLVTTVPFRRVRSC